MKIRITTLRPIQLTGIARKFFSGNAGNGRKAGKKRAGEYYQTKRFVYGNADKSSGPTDLNSAASDISAHWQKIRRLAPEPKPKAFREGRNNRSLWSRNLPDRRKPGNPPADCQRIWYQTLFEKRPI